MQLFTAYINVRASFVRTAIAAAVLGNLWGHTVAEAGAFVQVAYIKLEIIILMTLTLKLKDFRFVLLCSESNLILALPVQSLYIKLQICSYFNVVHLRDLGFVLLCCKFDLILMPPV